MALGPRIQFRPTVHEAVAPYVRPATPATRDLTATEARETLERDWLHQADGNPTPERIRNEIRWTRDLIERLRSAPAPASASAPAFAAELAALDARSNGRPPRSRPPTAPSTSGFAKRNAPSSRNPALHFDRVLFVDMPFPQGSEWPHKTRHRLGYMAVPGARLLVLDGLRPDGHLTQLMPQAPLHGSFWRPDVSVLGRPEGPALLQAP